MIIHFFVFLLEYSYTFLTPTNYLALNVVEFLLEPKNKNFKRFHLAICLYYLLLTKLKNVPKVVSIFINKPKILMLNLFNDIIEDILYFLDSSLNILFSIIGQNLY